MDLEVREASSAALGVAPLDRLGTPNSAEWKYMILTDLQGGGHACGSQSFYLRT
jgi:hypothetical protein